MKKKGGKSIEKELSIKRHTRFAKEKQQEKKRKQDILVVTSVFLALFLWMIGYLTTYMITRSETDINNSYNPRQALLAGRNIRGSIYSRNHEILAGTNVDADGTETRVYPYSALFSHVVGYSEYGQMGIEKSQRLNLVTTHTSISEKAENSAISRKDFADDIYTTLDVDIQKAAYNALGSYKGAIIAMEPSTGKILAMVSKPDFDPNEISDIWQDTIDDEESTILLNRATQGLYPPGSTFKIVTALEYIRENPDTYQEYRYTCNGKFSKGEDVINCYHGINHGKINLTEAFAKSCNSAFADISVTLNRNTYSKTLSELLFNQDIPLEIAYSKSKIEVDDTTSDSMLIQASIGQGTDAVTPLHMSLITSAIANKGTLMRPMLVEQVRNHKGELVRQYSTSSFADLMSETEASILAEMMTKVVEEGTATKLSGQAYTVAGKTGSAEYSGVKEESHAWFTGFAPVEAPQIVVTVILEGGGSGGDNAAPIARRVFDACLLKQNS